MSSAAQGDELVSFRRCTGARPRGRWCAVSRVGAASAFLLVVRLFLMAVLVPTALVPQPASGCQRALHHGARSLLPGCVGQNCSRDSPWLWQVALLSDDRAGVQQGQQEKPVRSSFERLKRVERHGWSTSSKRAARQDKQMTGLARFEHAWLTLAAPYHVPLHGARKTTSLGQCMCVRCKRPAGKLVCEDITTSCSGGGIPKAADDVFVRCVSSPHASFLAAAQLRRDRPFLPRVSAAQCPG